MAPQQAPTYVCDGVQIRDLQGLDLAGSHIHLHGPCGSLQDLGFLNLANTTIIIDNSTNGPNLQSKSPPDTILEWG
jgi:hypothetical protein